MPRSRKKPENGAQRRCKGLIYSPPKFGKTHLLGTAAHDERTAPVAGIDFEGGMPEILETMPGWGTDFIHIPIKTWDDFNEGYERIRENDEGFKSVAFDSLSETHIFALMSLLDDGRPSREKNPDLIEQGDYGVGLVQLRRLTRYFRDLPLHVFYTAHDKEEVDTKEGRVKMVNLAGKAATEIPGLMSLVGYLDKVSEYDEKTDKTTEVRHLLMKNYEKIRIGVRAPWGTEVPDEIEDPTVTKILDALNYTH